MKATKQDLQNQAGLKNFSRYDPAAFMPRCFYILLAAALPFAGAGCKHFQPKDISAQHQLEQLESRTLEDEGLRSFLRTNAPSVLEKVESKPWDLNSLTWAAIYFHPSMEVARAQWQVAQSGVKTAGGRPNPTVTITPEYNFSASGVSPWLPAVNFDIPVETAGKRSHRITRAEHLAEVAKFNMAVTAWQIRSNLRNSLASFAAVTRRTEILQRQLEVQNQIVKLLEGRVAAGAIAAIEVTSARVAATRALSDLAEARRLSSEGRALIAEAIGIPLSALEKVRLQPDAQALDLRQLTSSELRRAALTSRADLLAALAEYAASQSTLQLEIAKQYPDIHIGTGYQWDQGENKWALGITAEIPVLNRNQGPIAEAEARRAEAAARFTALQAKVFAEIQRASASLAAAREQITLLESARQAQQKALASLQASLKAGAADQFDVATGELELHASELAVFDTNLKLQQAVAQLEDALQQPFDALQVLQKKSQGKANTP
jgi:cobalt-zinc-cadmium efflux system outer membrane protein